MYTIIKIRKFHDRELLSIWKVVLCVAYYHLTKMISQNPNY